MSALMERTDNMASAELPVMNTYPKRTCSSCGGLAVRRAPPQCDIDPETPASPDNVVHTRTSTVTEQARAILQRHNAAICPVCGANLPMHDDDCTCPGKGDSPSTTSTRAKRPYVPKPRPVRRQYGRIRRPTRLSSSTSKADPLPDAFFSLDGEGSTAALDMSLFPSFLTDHTGSGPTANRQAPSPIHPPYSPVQQQQHHPGGPQLNAQAQNQQLAQQQQQQQQNGYGLGPPGVPGGGVNVFPTAAGHQLDLNHLWGQVQELSGVLERNRESTQGLVRRVGEVRSRAKAASEADGDGQSFNGLLRGLLINGDGENGVHPPDPHTRIQELESSNALLESENTDLATLVSTYENALARILDQLRIYAHEHTLATLAIHKSYTQQLAVERATNLELRQDYCEFQGRISSLARVVREGLRYEEDDGTGQAEGLKAVEAWAEIQNENRVLRGLVGLPVDEDGR